MAARRFWRALGKGFFYSVGALLIAFLIAQLWFYSHIFYWSRYHPETTAFMESRLAARPSMKLEQAWVPYDRISIHLKRAVVVAEDAKFLDHEGFDWEAIQEAMAKNQREGRVVAGASTISQQLAKNLFLSGERSWLRKGQEAIITWMLEQTMTKRRILELYLNVAEWGDGIFGAEAAARHHFGVSASGLTAEQGAWLAAILPSPRRYVRGRTTPYIDGRAATILARMNKEGAQIP
ncbi:monofunctional biosynthetic peptidoglycan transglycosylase [Betaproteobacteria bacterium SCGC AG-212-J23]|nr:monofunctional biosynthetic peptidoglycan transglycosylase [Betaproteobacteria bacterium SCGC AG-212-J23]